MSNNLLAVTIAEREFNKRDLHGMIESGGDRDIGDLFGLRIVPSKNSVLLQIITNGLNNKIEWRKYVRPKKVVIKEPKKPKEKQVKIDFDEVKEKSAW